MNGFSSNDVFIGKGDLDGKGIYAKRDFKKGEIAIKYQLKPLTKEQYLKLSDQEKLFTHLHWGIIHLYSEPERYVNHSDHPNTYQDLKLQADISLRDIRKGEMITTDAALDDVS